MKPNAESNHRRSTSAGQIVSRRSVLRAGLAGSLLCGASSTLLLRPAAAQTGRKKILVGLFQRGAVDGLNMVVPHGESAYYDRRPTISIPRTGAGRVGTDLGWQKGIGSLSGHRARC